ncbi:MAG: hypothetical protein M1826_001412 [Phylliscum demangeonii]|nr:MAG: hypothetical protein M1826_001412 [Phylliscum demangeonii]
MAAAPDKHKTELAAGDAHKRRSTEIARTMSATSFASDFERHASQERSLPSSPLLTASPRSGYLSSGSNSYQEDWEAFPPLDRLTVFDLLDNLALPQRLEKLQNTLAAQTEKVRRQREKLKNTGLTAKDRVVEEWRRRVPPPEEQLEKYRKRMRESVERLGRKWNDTKIVTTREKVSFIAGVLNIFISGYLIGAYPQYVHVWYTLQMLYFMPIRGVSYHQRGYHYFLADLCYFVNVLLMLSVWVFPRSKRLFISTYCLAYGNNAVAIAMWRNSLVFHSLDKTTSLFIHIMPPVVLHCIVHLIPRETQQQRFPAVNAIKTSRAHDTAHYGLLEMMLWATLPYAVWQLSYHVLITVRRKEKIAAGRPTSFTWLRRSYSKKWIGQAVLALPVPLQEWAFMLIQYCYALLTMVPCPLWFWNRWLSASFLLAVFSWSIYNGATFYIDVFGKRFQNELEQLKKDVARWQNAIDPPMSPDLQARATPGALSDLNTPLAGLSDPSLGVDGILGSHSHQRSSSVDQIPLLDGKDATASGMDLGSAAAAAAGPTLERPRARK